jgi:hypothetical protein
VRTISSDNLKELPETLRNQVKDDDHYLVRALITLPEAILVTTDTPLRGILTEHQLKAISREEFLEGNFAIK